MRRLFFSSSFALTPSVEDGVVVDEVLADAPAESAGVPTDLLASSGLCVLWLLLAAEAKIY